jgi:hypothetical protein
MQTRDGEWVVLPRACEAVKKSSCRGGPCGRPRATIPHLRDPYGAMAKRDFFTPSCALGYPALRDP